LFDPRFALQHAGLVVIVILSVFAGKAIILGVIARAFGYVNMAPWIVGLGLAQIGEFSFVLARTALSAGFKRRVAARPSLAILAKATGIGPDRRPSAGDAAAARDCCGLWTQRQSGRAS